MGLTNLKKQRIREICWNAVKNLNVDIKDRQTIEEGLYKAFTNEGAEGTQGPAGEDGKSAYELAVEQGYQGNLDEWLNSLQGQDGTPGADGTNAEITDCTATVDNTSGTPKVVVTMGGTASKRTFKFDFTGLVGAKGEPGRDGINGTDGRDGTQGPAGADGQDGASAGFGEPIATVKTLEAGQQATVSVTASGDDTNKVFTFNFGIPKGADGTGIDIKASAGECTAPGDAYIDENGNIQIWDGEQFNNGGQNSGPQGTPGPAGSDGENGKTPVFESGTATSVESTAKPSVQIVPSGTDDSGNPKYIINVSIPKGQKGDTGDAGPAGADGATGANGQDGAAGEDGKTPQFKIGNITTVDAGGNATAAVVQSGADEGGNPIYLINLGIPRGNIGATGANGADGEPGTNGTDGKTPNITINATVDNNSGTPSVTVNQEGTAEAPVINLAFKNLKGAKGDKGADGLDGEDATINLTQAMPGKLLIFPDSKNNEYRPVFNMREAANAFYNEENVLQTRFSQGDCVVDGDGKVWCIVATENNGETGTGGNNPAMQLSIVPKATA